MTITKIELAGKINASGIPDFFATIHRVPGNGYFTVIIVGPDSQREHVVEADCPEDVWSMAECLQCHLDGCKGTNSDIHEYFRILQHFTD